MDRPRGIEAALLAAALLATALAYLPGLAGPFVGDDFPYVVDNPTLRQVPLTAAWRLFADRTNPVEYLPLRDLSYRIDITVWGERPWGYKLHNLALYLASVLAAWGAARALARLLMDPRAEGGPTLPHPVAAGAAALFALHPAHVESVSWVSGRKDVLAGLLALLALWAFARALAPARDGGRPAPRPLLLAAVAFALALLAKGAVVTLGLVAPLVATAVLAPRHGSCGGALRGLAWSLPLLALAAGGAWLHAAVGAETGIRLEEDLPVGGVLERAVRILGALVGIALWPSQLRLTYDLYATPAQALALWTLGGVWIALSVWGGWRLLAARSLAGLGIVLFTAQSLPVLQIVPYQSWSLASERYLFLPVFGLCLAFAAVMPSRRRVLAWALVGLLAAGGGVLTARRAGDWRLAETLLVSNLERQPGSSTAVFVYVAEMLEQARFAEAAQAAATARHAEDRDLLLHLVSAARLIAGARAGPVGGAVDEAAEALRAYHDRLRQVERPIEGHARRVLVELFMGRALVGGYRSLLRAAPDHPGLHYNLGVALSGKSPRQALAHLRTAVALPGLPPRSAAEAWNRIGLEERRLGNLEESLEAFQRAMGIDADAYNAAYNLIASARAQGNRHVEGVAVAAFRERAIRSGKSAEWVEGMLSRR